MKHTATKIALGIILMTSLPIIAEEFRGHEGERNHHEAMHEREHHTFAVRDFAHFNRIERDLWRGGHWNKTCFSGRCGWWWFAEGQWYFYERRVGDYPFMVSDVTYLEPYAPIIVAPQAPVMVAPQPPVAAPQPAAPTWSYCASAKAYYPYVPSCPEGWQIVPAQPTPPAPR